MADKRIQRNGPEHQRLIEACRKADQKAQFEIYRRYYAAMYNTTLRIVGDPDDAEDVMQEAFLKAFTRIKTYRGEVRFGAWLKKIVINQALDFLRMRKDHIPLEEVGEPEDLHGETEDEVGEHEMRLEVEAIRKAISALPEGYRIVLSLILLEGYDHEEVSTILKVSSATSRTQYHRAKKKLLELLGKEKKI
ncbi:MAG: RNA polymerase sigma factor [Bacteroidales bacterium]